MVISDFLARLKGVKRGGKGATARCPAHEDNNNSLSVSAGDDGRVLVKCFAGCSADDICGALGIEVRELFNDEKPAKKGRPAKVEKPITLAELAAAKKLPVDFLREHGVEDFPDGSGVAIGYFMEDGSQHARIRKRTALRAKDGSSWVGPSGVSPIPYGVWRLAEWRE